MFWDQVRHDWPTDVFGFVDAVPVASIAALRGYRANYQAIHQHAATRPVTPVGAPTGPQPPAGFDPLRAGSELQRSA